MNKILNYTIYTLFFAIVVILGYNCYSLQVKLNEGPETIWKEYRTTEYIEKPVVETKTITKTKVIYKEQETNNNNDISVTSEKDDEGTITFDIK